MSRIITFVFFCVQVLYLSAECNRKVETLFDAESLPAEICLPEGYVINNVLFTDSNKDGLEDIWITWHKEKFGIGDTTFVSVYFQSKDSTYSLNKTFSNIFPIWFGDYDYRTIDENSMPEKWKSIFKKYAYMYEISPLRDYSIEKNLINLDVLYDAGSVIKIIYKYDVKKNNWFYFNSCVHYRSGDEEPIDLSKSVGPTIDDFDYLHIFE
ncbi:MAG: hypothetical protein PUC42_06375 [Bacteroidales bacterium]|nr:hypothetical protein [Bacteroidales bacterium]